MRQMEEKDWINDVLTSMEGSSRAEPSADLFDLIEDELTYEQTKIVGLSLSKIAAIAAIFLVCINIYAFQQFDNNRQTSYSSVDTYQTDLVSNLEIYL